MEVFDSSELEKSRDNRHVAIIHRYLRRSIDRPARQSPTRNLKGLNQYAGSRFPASLFFILHDRINAKFALLLGQAKLRVLRMRAQQFLEFRDVARRCREGETTSAKTVARRSGVEKLLEQLSRSCRGHFSEPVPPDGRLWRLVSIHGVQPLVRRGAVTSVRVRVAPIARSGCHPGRSPSRTGQSRSPRLGRLPAPRRLGVGPT